MGYSLFHEGFHPLALKDLLLRTHTARTHSPYMAIFHSPVLGVSAVPHKSHWLKMTLSPH
jgi:hypothetical protein